MKVIFLCLLLAQGIMAYPGYIQSSAGNYYHLWQLPEASAWGPEESISFSELENDLGDGYSSQVLYGASTGLRRWKLTLPTLAAGEVLPAMIIDIEEPVSGRVIAISREQYVWNLFCYTKRTGKPFVYRSLRDGQYYFVRFADKELSYKKARVKLYSTGVELKQVRVQGEAVFTPYIASAAERPEFTSPMEPDFWLKGTTTDESGNGNGFNTTGDVIETTVNDVPVLRFNSVTNSGYITAQEAPGFEYYDIFLLMKIRSGTFTSTNATVLTGTDPGDILVGVASSTAFGPTVTMEYRLNGVLYAEADMEGPMNTWGVVHIRFSDGQLPGTLRFGEADTTSAHMDIAEAIAYPQLLSEDQVEQHLEYLAIKAAQLNQ